MILYTIMPLESVYPTQQSEYERYVSIQYNGITVVGERNTDQTFLVNRIISTDPNHYLDTTLYPGSIISYTNQ
ncbi:YlzJ-like family protein [Peribacillus alkalitolerans]|uniref:YlzJ-like family protein n=1 Tax=Peribacillus alkalitolerans TaxID=1550385 RepID=UPI0013D0739F|nr:YlzJ-like family protein [Peribacillus alkalitolerans]